jgi:hypothetical protein
MSFGSHPLAFGPAVVWLELVGTEIFRRIHQVTLMLRLFSKKRHLS